MMNLSEAGKHPAGRCISCVGTGDERSLGAVDISDISYCVHGGRAP